MPIRILYLAQVDLRLGCLCLLRRWYVVPCIYCHNTEFEEGKPFIARLADITSRPVAYLVSLAFYIIGFIVVGTAGNIAPVAVGELLYSMGSVGLDLVTDIIVAGTRTSPIAVSLTRHIDLTPRNGVG